MVESPNLAWSGSRDALSIGARQAILSAGDRLLIAGPDHALLEPLSSTQLYTRLGNPSYGLVGFEGLSHPLFNRLIHTSGKLETTFNDLYRPVHDSISNFLNGLADASAQRIARDQLKAMEELADYMIGVSTLVRYTSIGTQYAVFEVTPRA